MRLADRSMRLADRSMRLADRSMRLADWACRPGPQQRACDISAGHVHLHLLIHAQTTMSPIRGWETALNSFTTRSQPTASGRVAIAA